MLRQFANQIVDPCLDWRRTPTRRTTALIFCAEVILLNLGQLPAFFNYSSFLLGDDGANLSYTYLINHGYRPGIDFAYIYGLLALLAGHFWFACFGLTPLAYQGAIVFAQLLVACALARLVANLKLAWPAVLLLAVTIPEAIVVQYFNFAHALEAVLLSSAIAEQAKGNRRFALALGTMACFARPALGFVYCGLLVAITFGGALRKRRFSVSEARRLFAPSLAVGIVLALLLSATYGIRPMLATIFPLAGIEEYRAMHWGSVWGRDTPSSIFLGYAWGGISARPRVSGFFPRSGFLGLAWLLCD